VEYRVLGNFWVLDKKMRQPVWDRMCQAIDEMRKRNVSESVGMDWNNKVIAAINNTANDDFLTQSLRFPVETTDPRYAAF
jgi:hypothetical protein